MCCLGCVVAQVRTLGPAPTASLGTHLSPHKQHPHARIKSLRAWHCVYVVSKSIVVGNYLQNEKRSARPPIQESVYLCPGNQQQTPFSLSPFFFPTIYPKPYTNPPFLPPPSSLSSAVASTVELKKTYSRNPRPEYQYTMLCCKPISRLARHRVSETNESKNGYPSAHRHQPAAQCTPFTGPLVGLVLPLSPACAANVGGNDNPLPPPFLPAAASSSPINVFINAM